MSVLFWISYGVMWILLLGLLLLMLLVFRQFGLVYLKTADGVSRGGIPVGTVIPDLQFSALSGSKVQLSDYAQQPLLLLFTAPTCAPCEELKPHLKQFLERYPALGTVIFSMHEKVEESERFVRDWGVRGVIVPLTDRTMYETRFDGQVTPFAFLLDGNRKVVAKGLVNKMEDLERLLETSRARFRDKIRRVVDQLEDADTVAS